MSEETVRRPSAPRADRVVARLVAWYRSARRDLPWRRTRDPYAVWVSETMLQQTRVETVIPYYRRFLGALPTVMALAQAPLEEVLSLWSGLGYYRRAAMLHAAARRVVSDHGGSLPGQVEGLRSLPGVGAYTAGAVASIAFGRRVPLVDGNVERVLARLYAVNEDVRGPRGRRRLWAMAASLVAAAPGDPGECNQALMELGAMVCVARTPRCPSCPLAGMCLARSRGLAHKLPIKARKKPPAAQHLAALVLASPRRVLLARRRADVMFGGLWEPPRGPRLADLATALGVSAQSLRPVGTVVHVLSHRRLQIEVARGALDGRTRFAVPSAEYDAIEPVRLARLDERAQAALARKLLEVANVRPRGLGSGAE